jgi:glycine/D-amino acid oxidase-like deaminating enzyme
MSKNLDIVVAGGGLAGVLAAAKLKDMHPDRSIAVFEKEAVPGGRLSKVDLSAETWSFGLNYISRPLFDFFNQTAKMSPESEDLEQFVKGRQSVIGCMSGSDLGTMPMEGFFGQKGARLIGGLTASREWPSTVEQFVQDVKTSEEKADASVASGWQGNRKGASAIVLEQMAHAFGLPEIWGAAGRALVERAQYHTSQLIYGDWAAAIGSVIKSLSARPGFEFHMNSMIGAAKFADGQWTLHTSSGLITAKALVVAQSVWDALNWLPQDYWPAPVLSVALKSKPVSVVSISDRMTTKLELPQVVLIPAENVQAIISPDRSEVAFQATLDYELSLQAPECVKAVKRLKRARKKFLAAVKEVELEGEHIALLPVGWAQSTGANDRRYFERLAKGTFNAAHLGFCGDCYGASYDGDDNLMKSVLSVCSTLQA